MALAQRLQQISLKEILVGMIIASLLVLMFAQQRSLVQSQERITDLTRQLLLQSAPSPYVVITQPPSTYKFRLGAAIAIIAQGNIPIGLVVKSPVRFRVELIDAKSGRSAFDSVFTSSSQADPHRVDLVCTVTCDKQTTAGFHLLKVQMLNDEDEPMATGTVLIEIVAP